MHKSWKTFSLSGLLAHSEYGQIYLLHFCKFFSTFLINQKLLNYLNCQNIWSQTWTPKIKAEFGQTDQNFWEKETLLLYGTNWCQYHSVGKNSRLTAALTIVRCKNVVGHGGGGRICSFIYIRRNFLMTEFQVL